MLWIGESIEDLTSALYEKLDTVFITAVEQLDTEHEGLVAFALGRSDRFIPV